MQESSSGGVCPVTGMKAGQKVGFWTRLYLRLFHRKATYS